MTSGDITSDTSQSTRHYPSTLQGKTNGGLLYDEKVVRSDSSRSWVFVESISQHSEALERSEEADYR
jgi:hypothetical protein